MNKCHISLLEEKYFLWSHCNSSLTLTFLSLFPLHFHCPCRLKKLDLFKSQLKPRMISLVFKQATAVNWTRSCCFFLGVELDFQNNKKHFCNTHVCHFLTGILSVRVQNQNESRFTLSACESIVYWSFGPGRHRRRQREILSPLRMLSSLQVVNVMRAFIWLSLLRN